MPFQAPSLSWPTAGWSVARFTLRSPQVQSCRQTRARRTGCPRRFDDGPRVVFLRKTLFFAIGVVGLALIYLTRLARPGGERKPRQFWSRSELSRYSPPALDPNHRYRTFRGHHCCSAKSRAYEPFSHWYRCRSRRRERDGLRASLHGRFIPFVAVWPGGTIALCTLAGVALGPRLLRW